MTFPIRIRVPATTGNLGPGFDTLGLALSVYNVVVATPAPALAIDITGEGSGELPLDASNLLVRALTCGCEAAGVRVPPLRLNCTHAIPQARGLGSSAAAAVAGLTLADALSGGALGRKRVLALTTKLEGHPDNAAPAIYGGIQASVLDKDGTVYHASIPCPTMPHVALFIPDFPMSTQQARAVLPLQVHRRDAIFNLSRTALLVAALASGHDELLDVATEDVLHQPPREAIFPAMPKLFHSARSAGALGVWLSGAGSTIAAFARPARAAGVAQAMEQAAREAGLTGRALVATVDYTGAEVIR